MDVTVYGVLLIAYILCVFIRIKNSKAKFLILLTLSAFLYTNITIGYVVKIGEQTVAGYFVATLATAFAAVPCIKRMSYDRFKYMVLFLGSMVTAVALIPIMKYTVVDQRGWDYYLFGANNLAICAIDGTHIKELIKAVSFLFIIEAAHKLMKDEDWNYVIDKVVKASKLVLIYGVLEFVSVYFLRIYNLYTIILQPIFGIKNSTYAYSKARGLGHQLQGLFTEPSAYSTGLFLIILMLIVQYQMKKERGNKIEFHKTLLWISVCIFLMILSMAFVTILYLGAYSVMVVAYLYKTFPKLRIYITVFLIVIASVITGIVIYLIDADTYWGKRLVSSLYIFKTAIFNQDLGNLYFHVFENANDGSSISRIGSAIGILRLEFIQNPVIGLGVGTANSYSLVSNMLTELGVVGIFLWLKIVFLNRNKKKYFFLLALIVLIVVGFLSIPFNYFGVDAILLIYMIEVLYGKNRWG